MRNLLRGELDWIVLKALEKDRTRRYESASALARDVARFLNHEAVEAFPPSQLYRFRKFARRNRWALASTTLVFLALLTGIGIATWQSLRAIREKNNVEIARAESEQLASLGLEVLDQIYLNVLGDRLRGNRRCPPSNDSYCRPDWITTSNSSCAPGTGPTVTW